MILCSGTLGRIPFRDKVRAAAAAGFTGVSIYRHEAEPGLRGVLDDLGLAVAEVDGAMAWMPGQPGPEPAAVLELAATLRARSVTIVETALVRPDLAAAAAGFAAVCALAAPLGLVVHLEPFAWSGVASLADAVDIVRGAGAANGGILLDTWHLVRGPDAGVVPPAAVSHVVAVQISDPAPVARGTLRDECLHDRRLPGPVTCSVLAQLPPGLPIEVEVFGLDLSAVEAARAAFRAAGEATSPGGPPAVRSMH